MPRKSPHELEPGMVLASDVYNLDGRLLFPKGQQLSGKKIEILMMWGVESVHIVGDDEAKGDVAIDHFSLKIRREAEAAVQRRFKLVKSAHPAVETIRKIAVLEAAKAAQAESPQS